MMLKKRSKPTGVNLPNGKLTETPIEPVPLPQTVVILVPPDNGTPAVVLVKKGDKVLTGQKITDPVAFNSVPVYASASGEVSNVTMTVDPWGHIVRSVIITTDGKDTKAEFQPLKNADVASNEEIIKKIRDAGVFAKDDIPAHVKLSPPQDKKIDTVILDGCDEPYGNAEHEIMLEHGQKVLSGLNIIKKVLSPDKVYIAIADDKGDALRHMEKLTAQNGYSFEVVPVESKYPAGAEKVLIKTILDREVPIGGTAADAGVAVFDVNTAKAIHEAVFEGKPYIEKVVTVIGAVSHPKNLLVRLGTPIKNLLELCGGMAGNDSEVIMGNPLTGIVQLDLGFPVCNGTDCLLIMAPGQRGRIMNCVNCGRCVEACPMGLMPCNYPKYVKVGRYTDCQRCYIDDCVECGTCAYTCPSRIPILQYIRIAKRELYRRAEKK